MDFGVLGDTQEDREGGALMVHVNRQFLKAGGVDRRRNHLRKDSSRSAFFALLAIELNGVVGEGAELAVLVESAERKPSYAGVDEG